MVGVGVGVGAAQQPVHSLSPPACFFWLPEQRWGAQQGAPAPENTLLVKSEGSRLRSTCGLERPAAAVFRNRSGISSPGSGGGSGGGSLEHRFPLGSCGDQRCVVHTLEPG